MPTKKHTISVSHPVDLSREVYAAGGDFQLLCCSGAGDKPWVSAAELVYEFTGEPGTVVRNTITFDLGTNERIELNLLDGSFELFKDDRSTGAAGRKGIDLLMKWKGMSYEEALEFVSKKYSKAHAEAMGADFLRMQAEPPQGGPRETPA